MANGQVPNKNIEENPVAPIASWLVTLTPFEMNFLSFVVASLLIKGLSKREQISVSILFRNISVLLITGVEQSSDQDLLNF